MSKDNYGKCAECPIEHQKRICSVNDGFGPKLL